jgi:drug/metabolite transporter (DMT)-like permease
MRAADITRLIALAILWGGSFLLYRIIAPALGTIVATEARVGIAGIALLAWQALAGSPFEWRTHQRAMLTVGITNSALPFACYGYAAHVLPAGYLAIINATAPLFGAIIARLWLGEALEARRVAGIALGVIGVVVLVGLGPVAVDAKVLLACVACLIAATSYGFAGNYTRQLKRPVPPASMATGSQLAAAFVVLPLIPFEPLQAMPTMTIVIATLIIAIACTSVAYLLYFRLIRDIGATRALTVTFLVPLFAIAWGWLVLEEVPTPRMAIGATLVLAATWLIVARSRLKATATLATKS